MRKILFNFDTIIRVYLYDLGVVWFGQCVIVLNMILDYIFTIWCFFYHVDLTIGVKQNLQSLRFGLVILLFELILNYVLYVFLCISLDTVFQLFVCPRPKPLLFVHNKRLILMNYNQAMKRFIIDIHKCHKNILYYGKFNWIIVFLQCLIR